MLTVITFLFDGWRHKAHRETVFTAAHVNNVCGMYREHLTVPHKFVCVTDDPTGIECETYPIWENIEPPGWNNRASDFMRLDLFKEFGKRFGERIVMTDLDVWLLKNIDHLITDHDFRILACPLGYCTAFWMLRTGTRPELAEYDPETWTAECEQLKAEGRFVRGSDQSVVNARARADEATYGPEDGVYLIGPADNTIPRDACMAMFYGTMKPWIRPEFRSAWWGSGSVSEDSEPA